MDTKITNPTKESVGVAGDTNLDNSGMPSAAVTNPPTFLRQQGGLWRLYIGGEAKDAVDPADYPGVPVW